MPNGRVKASCTDPRKCYENTFDGSKSRVTKVDEDRWKKRAERRLRREKEGRGERKRERETATACKECLRVPYVTNRRREATFMKRGKLSTYIVLGRQATPGCHTFVSFRVGQ